jgi:hypothetical protein
MIGFCLPPVVDEFIVAIEFGPRFFDKVRPYGTTRTSSVEERISIIVGYVVVNGDHSWKTANP